MRLSFIDNVKSCFTSEELPLSPSFRAVMFGDRAIYFEGILSIVYYAKEEIVLQIKKGKIKIKGQDLYIKKYCGGDVAICGLIKGMEKD